MKQIDTQLLEPLSKPAKVSAWQSTPSTTQQLASFGMRLGRQLRDRWVESGATEVQLQLEGIPDALVVTLSSAFWNKCPEFKHERFMDSVTRTPLPV